MTDLEFYRDEDGNPCARGRDERLATFIQTDLQESVGVITDLIALLKSCLLYTSPSPRDKRQSRMPSSA